jgi:uncharacterized phage protein (TIGR01671 family)
MNREIKFRAWHLEDGMLYFDLDNFIKDYHDQYGNIMQYTGLKDKNGNEVYESDIVQSDAWNYPFEVIFNNEKARFVCKLKTGLTQYIDGESLVVVGNIYETPQLLKP